MDDMQKQAKDLLNKFSNPFKPKFKGQGHRLGSSEPSSSSPAPSNTQGVGRTLGTTKGVTSQGNSGASRPIHPLDRGKQGADRVPQGRTASQVTGNSLQDSRLQSRNSFRPQNESSLNSTKVEPLNQVTTPRYSIASSVRTENRPTGENVVEWQASPLKVEDGHVKEQYQCPICQLTWKTAAEVENHVEDCLSKDMAERIQVDDMEGAQTAGAIVAGSGESSLVNDAESLGPKNNSADVNIGESDEFWEVHKAVGALISTAPSHATMDILVKILTNICNDPTSDKFRRLRLRNPKIADSIGKVGQAMELIQAMKFELIEEVGEGGDKELVAVMKQPDEAHLACIKEALSPLQTHLLSSQQNMSRSSEGPKFSFSKSASESKIASGVPPGSKDGESLPKPVVQARRMDRKMRVYLPAPENLAARIEVPESFFVRSADEVRSEMLARKKQMESSQMLVTRAWREKQAAASKRRYSAAILRVQFPDMLVLEGVFHPSEPTSAIYEFVAEALLDPAQEFQLCHPIPTRSPFIPSVATPKAPIPTLEEADLIPASLIKFRAVDIGTGGYTGLKKELIISAETLAPTKYPPKR